MGTIVERASVVKTAPPSPTCSSTSSSHGDVETRVSEFHLVMVNMVVAGLEIAASVAFTFIPPLLLKSGYSETQMTIIFGVAPFIALYTVPLIGKWSDECTSPWGRRRPYIFILSMFLIISLVLLVCGQSMVTTPMTKVLGMWVVSFAVILLDYASQAAINPCESLVADILKSASNANTGFMIYSAMLSLGSCVGYLLSALDWSTLAQITGNSEQTAILIVLVLFTMTLVVTMTSARERPLKHPSSPPTVASVLKTKGLTFIDSASNSSDDDEELGGLGRRCSSGVEAQNLLNGGSSPARRVTSRMAPRSILQCICNSFRPSFIFVILAKVVAVIFEPFKEVQKSPPVLQRLFMCDLLCWMALMSHNMFCTDYVATVVYGGKPEAERGSLEDIRFDEGVRMGSLGLLLHSITACLFASFVQDSLTNLIGLKSLYLFGLITFGTSMLITVLFPSVIVLNVCAAFSGVGFAVATTIPGTLITKYHANPEIYYRSRDDQTIGFGRDMAVIDLTYYLSQIILSVVMGQLVEATGLPHFYIIVSSLCAFGAAILSTRVYFTPADCK